MLLRIGFIFVTLFWLTMNVLLWRAEYGAGKAAGSPVPIALVGEKILTAPDSSSLTIVHEGQRVGFCHWTTSVGEELSQLREEDDPTAPEGMVRRVTGYRVQLEGSVMPPDYDQRFRFECSLELGTRYDWRQFRMKINMRPYTWAVHAVAQEERVAFTYEEGQAKVQRSLSFAELQHPERWAVGFAGPLLAAMLEALPVPLSVDGVKGLASSVRWDSRHGNLRLSHTPVRVYRLQGEVLERYRVVVWVSRVGEILRVELPGQVSLVNDQLSL
jgi:hypothetical protein